QVVTSAHSVVVPEFSGLNLRVLMCPIVRDAVYSVISTAPQSQPTHDLSGRDGAQDEPHLAWSAAEIDDAKTASCASETWRCAPQPTPASPRHGKDYPTPDARGSGGLDSFAHSDFRFSPDKNDAGFSQCC